MARSRNLKPGFFKNDQLADCGPVGMVVFAGLWCLADCNGNLEYRPRRIKAEVIPYFDDDMEQVVAQLVGHGFLELYGPTGREYLHIVNFLKHQNPHKKERDTGSDIPGPDEFRAVPGENPDQQGADTVDEARGIEPPKPDPENPAPDPENPELTGLIPDSLFPLPDSGFQENPSAPDGASSSPRGEDPPPRSEPVPYEAVVHLYHETLPELPAVQLLNKKRKAALRQRHTGLMQRELDSWRAYFETVSRSDFLMGRIDGKGWRADFDFLLTEKAVTGVIEGKYQDNRSGFGSSVTTLPGRPRASPGSSRHTSLQDDLSDTSWATGT